MTSTLADVSYLADGAGRSPTAVALVAFVVAVGAVAMVRIIVRQARRK